MVIPSYWKPDAESPKCHCCNGTFILLWRHRHHCRICGGCFCAQCSPEDIELLSMGIESPARSCQSCERFARESVPSLLYGTKVKKKGNHGRWSEKWFMLSEDLSRAVWTSPKDRDKRKELHLVGDEGDRPRVKLCVQSSTRLLLSDVNDGKVDPACTMHVCCILGWDGMG